MNILHLSTVLLVLVLCFMTRSPTALDNGLARTPPMGWLTWERFRCNTDCVNFPSDCISERLIKETADKMVTHGWLKFGYNYISIDDCWAEKTRDSAGHLVPDRTRFPNGMKALADYVHSKGLKFGIYGDFGGKTCAGYPGSEFYLQQDAKTFASWGVDMVKLDACNSDPRQQIEGFEVFGFYLNKTGRPMLYSCCWPAHHIMIPKTDADALIRSCNIWRLFIDIQDSWKAVTDIVQFYSKNPYNMTSWAGPGHFNDPDMLIIGNFGLSYDQQRAQMAMWAIFAAPLMMSTDLRKIRNDSKALLQNPRLIAINQDPLGKQGVLVSVKGPLQLWKRSLHDGSIAVALLNEDNQGQPTRVMVNLTSLGLSKTVKYQVLEAFEGRVLGNFLGGQSIPFVVNPTGVVLTVIKTVK